MKFSGDSRYPAFTFLAHQSDNYRIALRAGDAAPGPNYIVRQNTLKPVLAEWVQGNLNIC